MRELISFTIYGFAIISNFLFIYFCPPGQAKIFLSLYAASSLVFSLLSLTFYTTYRKLTLDYIIFIGIALALAADFIISDSRYILYILSAAVLIIVDFSCAQSERRTLVDSARLGIFASAAFLLYSFEAALVARSVWLLTCHLIAIRFKNYPADIKFTFPEYGKLLYSGTTCIFYFGPLMLVPILELENEKILYISYAIMGNLVLKYQDYSMKKYISGTSFSDLLSRSFLLGLSAIFVALVSFQFDERFVVFLLPIVTLVYCDRIMKNVEWR